MNSRWQGYRVLALEALQFEPEARARFLDANCANDAHMRAEIEALISSDAADRRAPPGRPLPVLYEPLPRALAGHRALAAGETIGQHYRLVRELGEGGMGRVWLGEQSAPIQRPVALKFIKEGMYDAAIVRRFTSERQSLSIMDHGAIARVFDAGATTEGQPYFVMEYVPGLSITEHCDKYRKSVRDCVRILMQAADGVQHAHQKGVVHGDLKPANILVIDAGAISVPKIIDFGLARFVTARRFDDPAPMRRTQFFGTPGYVSPEQVDPGGQDVDTRTDVYSLGVILYVLLTGTQPFELMPGENPAYGELMRRLLQEDPVPPSVKLSMSVNGASDVAKARSTTARKLLSELHTDLDWVVMKALMRNREQRYATCSEFAADLRRYLNHDPVLARPSSMRYQLTKLLRRHLSS